MLWDRYNPLVKRYRDQQPETPPASVIQREGAIDPASPLVAATFRLLRELKGQGRNTRQVAAALRDLRAGLPG